MHAFFVSVWEFVNLWLAFSASEPDAKKAWAKGTAEHVHQSALQGVPVSKVSIGITCLFNFTWNLENLPYIIYSYILIFLHEIHTAMQSSLSSESNHDIKMLSVCPTSGERGISWHEKVREQEDTYTNT